MKRCVLCWLRAMAVLPLLFACTSDSVLKPFTSDGCSLFPDQSLIDESDWCSCCFEHDIAYWRGGTEQQREDADEQLRRCVLDRTQNETFASLMHEGVRLGGSPYFYNWYRWGYGWGYERKYQALTSDEQVLAEELLSEYFSSTEEKVCQ